MPDKEKRASAKTTYIVNSDGSKAAESVKESDEVVKEFSLETAVIYYDDKAFEPNAASEETLEQLVNALKEKEELKIVLSGHIDKSEAGVNLLAKKRAFTLRKKLKEMGIDDARMSHLSKESSVPADNEKPELNRRVTISIK